MFEFKGAAAESTDGNGPDWRIVDHRNIQDLGRRPFTAMILPAHQRAKTEGATRPSPPLRSRSNSFAPNYSRPQDKDDLSPVATSFSKHTPRSPIERRPVSGGSGQTRGDSLDAFIPKAWMAKGSRFLKRQNRKHELTPLDTLESVEDSEEARLHYLPPPSEYRHSRMRSAAALRYNISEPFNFQHITHTRPHHVPKLEEADPNELVSEFSALRASQASRPELKGIKAKDIRREGSPRDTLLPDCPSQAPSYPSTFPQFTMSRNRDRTPDSPRDAVSPAKDIEYSQSTDDFSPPSACHQTARTSPTSPHPLTLSRHLTPDFTFHDDHLSDESFEALIPTESPEPLDSMADWNDGLYDLASPHAVTTDDGADWNRQVPFSMVKTELAPVKEVDETSSLASSVQGKRFPRSGVGNTESSPGSKSSHWVPSRSASSKRRAAERSRALSTRPLPVEEKFSKSLHEHNRLPAEILDPSIEDSLDGIPARARFSRCVSSDPNDMNGFWDMASDAINCSYALGAEGDSNFDWHRRSISENELAALTADGPQTIAPDVVSESPEKKPQPDSLPASGTATRRSSSVYSTSPPLILPLQTFPTRLDPPSASSTESSCCSISEAITPTDNTESAIATRFSNMSCKEWSEPAYMVDNDLESETAQEDVYHQMFTINCTQEAPFQLHNVGRIDGSTISNSPRSSRSPISKSSSQESFWFSQAGLNSRRPRNAGSVGSLPELVSSKTSRERFDSACDQYTDTLTFPSSLESHSDSQQTSAAQRRRSPNLAKDAAQNIILSKVRNAEEPLPLPLPSASSKVWIAEEPPPLPLPLASRDRASSDVTSPSQDPSVPSSSQPTAGRRMRSGSSGSNVSARGSRGSYSLLPLPLTTSARNR